MTRLICSLLGSLALLTGCLSSTPFQSARVVETNAEAITLAVQRSMPERTYYSSSSVDWTMADVTARFPLVKGMAEFSLNGAAVMYDGGGFGGMVGLGLKAELIPDYLSVEVPSRLWLSGEDSFESAHIYPRAIFSLPVHENIELNLSATRFIFLEGDGIDGPTGYSIGLALGKKNGLIIRPEFGVLSYSNGHKTYQFGVGFTPGRGLPKRADSGVDTPF